MPRGTEIKPIITPEIFLTMSEIVLGFSTSFSLRKIKNKGYKSIAVEKIPNIGLGKTINDRLRRASKY